MRFSEKTGAHRRGENPLPPKIASLLRESSWLIVVALALYLGLILLTFDKADPGWSHSATGARRTANNSHSGPVGSGGAR